MKNLIETHRLNIKQNGHILTTLLVCVCATIYGKNNNDFFFEKMKNL